MDFKRCFSRIWPFSVLVFLVIIFFWRFFFKGSIPIPADIIVGMYFPWLDYKWGYTVGVPVKNSLISDVVSLFFPMKSYLISSLKNGRLPLWNPYMFGGYPFLGNIQLGIFNPTNLFYFVSPVPVAWGMQIFFQTLFCGLFIYWLLRYLKISKLSSLLGGIVYSFSGFSIIWSQWGSHVFTASFLPLLLLFSSKYLRSGKIRFGVLFSLTLALQIFSGYPQVIVYSVFAEILFVMIVEKFWQKRAIDLILFFILGITLSGIQLFPSFELLINSRRQIETINRNEAYLKNNNLISFFAPDYFGNITTGNYWGEGNYTRNSGYSGIVVVILASLAVIFIKKKEILFLLLLFVFSLSFAFPSPAAIFLNKLKFLGLGGAAGDRVLFLANFSLAALAAFGLDFLKQKYDFKVIRSLYLPTIVVFGVLTGSFLSRQSFRSFSGVATDSFSREVLEGWLRNLNVGMRNLVLPLGFILASCLLLILGVLRNSLSRLVRISFLFLVYFELVRFG